MDALQITPISQANASQRTGRAGRTGNGYVRLPREFLSVRPLISILTGSAIDYILKWLSEMNFSKAPFQKFKGQTWPTLSFY